MNCYPGGWGGNLDPLRSVDDLCARIRLYHPQADLSIIRKAYDFSEKAHLGQFRRSGEPYISHPLSVAGILAELRLDLDSVATGILHDTVEDTPATLADIRRGIRRNDRGVGRRRDQDLADEI